MEKLDFLTQHSIEANKQPVPEVNIAVSVRSVIVTEVKSKVSLCASDSCTGLVS